MAIPSFYQVGFPDDVCAIIDCMEKHHAKVDANVKTAWFFTKSWNHVFAKVIREGHANYKVEVIKKHTFNRVFHHFSGDFKDDIRELGEILIQFNRKKQGL